MPWLEWAVIRPIRVDEAEPLAVRLQPVELDGPEVLDAAAEIDRHAETVVASSGDGRQAGPGVVDPLLLPQAAVAVGDADRRAESLLVSDVEVREGDGRVRAQFFAGLGQRAEHGLRKQAVRR